MNLNESVIRRFLLGETSAADLDCALREARVRVAPNHGLFRVVDMDEPYVFSRADALTLLDATIAGGLSTIGLEDLAFLLIASDTFEFQDGDELTLEVVHDWAAPEINLPLTSENLHWFRQVLLEEIPYPPRLPLNRSTQPGAPIKVREKQPPLVGAYSTPKRSAIPGHADQVIHAMPISENAPCRSGVPRHADQI